MADESPLLLSHGLIAGRYAVDTAQPWPDAAGGLPACLTLDKMAADGRRVAVSVSRDASPRIKHLNILDEPIDNLMVPLGYGLAPLANRKGEGLFVICAPPPGPPVSAKLNPWPEKALIDLVLRPIAGVLDVLHSRKLTHRGIRPNNVFQSAPGQPVTLGAAWAAPPAMHQPAVFESPYSAMCLPACRGDGSIADDVYALGVLLITLWAGKVPMTGVDDATAIRWKLDMGSYGALTRDVTMSNFLVDLLRGMLAEDPDHRPLPSVLVALGHARGRRVAARPGRRSQHPLMLNDTPVFDARTLAWGLFRDEKKAVQFLRNGLVTQWLRRALGDAGLATQIEDLVRGRMNETKPGSWSDPLLVMHTISALNPRMPLCWRGIALWPDALPAIMAEGISSKSDLMAAAEELLLTDIVPSWSARVGRPDAPDLGFERQLLQAGGPGGLLRVFYGLNPMLPCRIPAMASAWIASVPDLMRCFETSAGSAGEHLIDMHVAAFIAARSDRKIETKVNGMLSTKDAETFRQAELSLLREMQIRYHPEPMPVLAKWVATRLRPDVDRWRNKPRRDALQVRIETVVPTGNVARLLDLASDPTARAADILGSQRASHEVAVIDAELAEIDSNDAHRFAAAERFGEAMAGGIGLSAFILMAMSVLLR